MNLFTTSLVPSATVCDKILLCCADIMEKMVCGENQPAYESKANRTTREGEMGAQTTFFVHKRTAMGKKVTMSPLLLSQEKNLNPHPFPPTTTIHFFIFIIQALQFSSALSLIKRSISAAIGPKGPSFQ